MMTVAESRHQLTKAPPYIRRWDELPSPAGVPDHGPQAAFATVFQRNSHDACQGLVFVAVIFDYVRMVESLEHMAEQRHANQEMNAIRGELARVRLYHS